MGQVGLPRIPFRIRGTARRYDFLVGLSWNSFYVPERFYEWIIPVFCGFSGVDHRPGRTAGMAAIPNFPRVSRDGGESRAWFV